MDVVIATEHGPQQRWEKVDVSWNFSPTILSCIVSLLWDCGRRKSILYLFCSQCCWDTQRRSEARASPATRGRSSSRCSCTRCGCARTSPWAWTTVTGSTWVWSQRRWWRWRRRAPWSFSFCSWLAENLEDIVLAQVSKAHPVATHFRPGSEVSLSSLLVSFPPLVWRSLWFARS